MRKIVLSLIALCAWQLNAQEITVSEPQQLMKGVESAAYSPVISADGSQVLFTSSSYQGLKLYDMDGNYVTKISDAAKAGYKPAFDNNGKVYFKTAEGLANANVNCYDLAKSTTVTVLSNDKCARVMTATDNNVVVRAANPRLKSFRTEKSTYVYTEGSKVIVAKNGREKAYSPIESNAGYIWASLSPDGQRVMFYVAETGIAIMDLNGNVINRLGKYEFPSWYGNDYIIAQNATDDGHQLSSSQIVLVKADGSLVKELTKPESMTMHPSASFKSNRVVYDTIDGRMFMLNVTIK